MELCSGIHWMITHVGTWSKEYVRAVDRPDWKHILVGRLALFVRTPWAHNRSVP